MAGQETITALRNYVAARQADKKIINTGLKETPFLSKAMAKKKILGGGTQELSVRNGEQVSNAKYYTPGGSDDYVGVTASSNVYQSIDPVVQLQFFWSLLGVNLRYSAIELQMAKTGSDSQLANFLGSRMDFTEDHGRILAGSGIVSGTGDGYQGTLASVTGSNASEPYGIIYQDRYFSGTANANTAGTTLVSNSNTHFGQSRHLHSELVGNSMNATSGYGSTISVVGATVTNGSTELSVMSSDDYTDYIGWEVWIDTAQTGDFVRLGREYVIADADTSAATTVQMSTIYRGATDTAVNIELRAPFNTTAHGAASVLTNSKIGKVYYQASDGNRTPDMINSNTRTFGAVSALLFDQMRWQKVVDSDYGSKGYDNFKYLGATWCADNNFGDGEIHMINTEYTRLCCLQGQDTYMIKPSDIVNLSAGQDGYAQYGADATFAFQLVSESPRSNGILKGLSV